MPQNQLLKRLHHLDILRGGIIILMIIDHAMVYCYDYNVSDPMTIPETPFSIFISRFLSHFCAPLFVFLAGLSAALIEKKYENTTQFAKSLIIRGLVLILLEFTLVSWSWSFNPTYPMLYAQVIWAIGWGFIILGLLSLLDGKVVLIFGMLVVFAHNLFDGLSFDPDGVSHYIWSALHQKNVLDLPFGFKVRTTYPFLPIAGLMCLAYCTGRYYVSHNFSRRVEQQGFILGIICLITYTILRVFNLYGDNSVFVQYNELTFTIMSFFNPTKYPLSLQFMLLTVGTGLIMLNLLARTQENFSSGFLQTLGKVSMFAYLAHLYLLHFISWLLIPVMGFGFSDMTYGKTLIGLPEGFGLSVFHTYLLAMAVTIGCVFLSKKYWLWKKTNKHNLIAKYI